MENRDYLGDGMKELGDKTRDLKDKMIKFVDLNKTNTSNSNEGRAE